MIILYKFITCKYWRYMHNNCECNWSRVALIQRRRERKEVAWQRRDGGTNNWNEKTKAERGCKEWPEAVEGWRKEGRSARLYLTPSAHPLLLRRPLASSWPSSPGRFSTAPKRRGQWDAGRRYWSEASSRRRPLQDARLARRERAAPQFEIKGRKPLLETSRESFRLPCVLYVRMKPRIWSDVARALLSPLATTVHGYAGRRAGDASPLLMVILAWP